MIKSKRKLYDGALTGSVVGGFVRLDENFVVIRPGFDSQGRRHNNWTQIVHGDVPVWEAKVTAPVEVVVEKFNALLTEHFARDKAFLRKMLDQTKKHRIERFRDGESGETPAQTVRLDGRGQGVVYAA